MNVRILRSTSSTLTDKNVVEGVKEQLELEESSSQVHRRAPAQPVYLPTTSRRRKGTDEVLSVTFVVLMNFASRASVFAVRARRTSTRSCFHGDLVFSPPLFIAA
jgi:hypothetical protein